MSDLESAKLHMQDVVKASGKDETVHGVLITIDEAVSLLHELAQNETDNVYLLDKLERYEKLTAVVLAKVKGGNAALIDLEKFRYERQ